MTSKSLPKAANSSAKGKKNRNLGGKQWGRSDGEEVKDTADGLATKDLSAGNKACSDPCGLRCSIKKAKKLKN